MAINKIEEAIHSILTNGDTGTGLGKDRITNGSFDTADNWDFSNQYWEHISAGEKVASFSCSTADKYDNFFQESIGIESGKTYRCTYTLSGMDNVSLWLDIRHNIVDSDGVTAERTSNGSYSDDLIADSHNNIWVVAYSETDSLSTAYVDDISLKEVLTACGIYPNYIPQDASLPALAYQQISGPREHDMSGANGLVGAKYQISVWAETYEDVRQAADCVRRDFDGRVTGTGNVTIQGIDLIDETDMPELGTLRGLHRYGKRQDYMIWFEE